MKIGLISGYFNPTHSGHLDYIEAAKAASDFLIVIVNNDLQVALKGSAFMDESSRLRIVKSLKAVDLAIISIDCGKSVVKTIEWLMGELGEYQLTLFNSGDRNPENQDSEESAFCKANEIGEVFLDLPKVESSSRLRTLCGQ